MLRRFFAKSMEAFVQEADHAEKNNEDAKAVRIYKRALRYFPKSAILYARLAIAQCRMQTLTEAAESCLHAIDIDPDAFDVNIAAGKVLQEIGDYKEALRYLVKARSIDSKSAEVYRLLGDLFLDQRKFDAARIQYEQVLSLEPMDVRARTRLGDILLSNHSEIR